MVQGVICVYTHICKSSTKSTKNNLYTNVSLVKNRVKKTLKFRESFPVHTDKAKTRPQSFTKNLRLTLVFMRNSALREKRL